MKIGSFVLGSITTLSVFVACGAQWKSPPSWTMDEEPVLRRLLSDGTTETFTAAGFIDYIEKQEGRNQDGSRKKALCLMPSGENSIATRIIEQDAKILELENRLRQCD